MRRGNKTVGKASKTKRRKTLKRRDAPKAAQRGSSLKTNVARLTRELEEALQQQTATSEVLNIIRRSPADAQPVFDAIIQSAARLCGAIFSVVYLYDGDRLRIAATHNFTAAATTQLNELQELKRPDRSHLGGRAILNCAIVHVHDVLADPEYSHELALAGGWRAVLAVPLLRDEKPVGALTVAKAEPTPFSDRQVQLLNTFADQALIAIENVRLFETEQQRTRELSESLEQQTATSEVLKVISSSPGELEPVFNALLANATRICEATSGNLFLCEGPIFRAVAVHSEQSLYDLRRNPVIDLRENPGIPTDRLAKTKQLIHIADLRTDQSYIGKNDRVVSLVEAAGARTFMAVPMLKEGELIGDIVLYRQEVRPFTDKQIELVQNFAAQAVIAIENTRLLNELRELLQQQTATADVLKVISSSPGELEPVFQAMLENATRICGAKFGTLYLYDGDAFHATTFHNAPPAFIQDRKRAPLRPGPNTSLGRAARTKQVAQIVDITKGESYLQRDPLAVAGADLGGYRTVVSVPMLKEDNLIGVISIYRQEVLPFTDKQIELVSNFAAQAVIAIENTRLLNELRESLQQQTATADVLKVISSSQGDLKPIFDSILINATRICEASFANLVLVEGDKLQLGAMYGAPAAFAEAVRLNPVVPRQTPVGRVIETKQLVHITDIDADESYRNTRLAKHAGARTTLGVPMLKDEQVIGAILIYRQEVRPFTDKQIELVKNFAAQAVIAIENTRLLNELRDSLEQQTATSEVLKVISSSPGDLEPVFNAMLENATRICEATFGNLFLREGSKLRAVAVHGKKTYADSWQRNPIIDLSDNSGVPLDRLANTKQITHVPDLRMEQSYLKKNVRMTNLVDVAGARTYLAVPMLKEDKLVGAIGLYREEVRPFSENQIDLVQNFAAQAVIAIENTRLLSELRESLQQQTATADVLKVISRSTFDLQTVLQTLVESAARLCDADKVNITRQRDGVFYRAEAYGFSREFMDYVKDVPIKAERGSAFGRALLEGRAIHIPDVKADPEYTWVEAQRLGDFRTVLSVPMLREGVPTGVLSLTRKNVRPFTDKQIELATTFADQAAIAIENVRLFERVEARTRELAASLEDLRTTQDRLVQTQKLASLGQLTAGIAHEIKNPLNFVNNFSAVSAELIDELRQALAGANLDNKLRAEITEIADTLQGNLDKVVQHGKRADAIVKNMLLHSREGSGEHRLVDINAIVEESLNLAYHGARAEKQGFNITLERSLDAAAGEVDVFPQDITRVLLNLISNGFYAATKRKTEANGGDYEPTLAAATKNLGDRVEITIRDNGTGIPPDVKEKMFNPFFTTKPAGEGTGLGLSISHDIIVKQHGGSIEVDTQPGEFTELRIILPRTAVFFAKSGGQV